MSLLAFMPCFGYVRAIVSKASYLEVGLPVLLVEGRGRDEQDGHLAVPGPEAPEVAHHLLQVLLYV